MMNYLDQVEFSEKLAKLADSAEYLAMTREELVQELKFWSKIYRNRANEIEYDMAMELDRMYQDDPVIPF